MTTNSWQREPPGLHGLNNRRAEQVSRRLWPERIQPAACHSEEVRRWTKNATPSTKVPRSCFELPTVCCRQLASKLHPHPSTEFRHEQWSSACTDRSS